MYWPRSITLITPRRNRDRCRRPTRRSSNEYRLRTRCWLIRTRSNFMMILGWQTGRRAPGRSRVGRIRTIRHPESFIGEAGQLRGRAEETTGRKGDIIARSRMRTPVETSETIMGRPTGVTKAARGTRPASTTGLEVKRRVATIESRNRNQQEVVNSIKTKIQMPRSKDLESMG